MPSPFDEAGNIIDPILKTFHAQLKSKISGHAVTGFIAGAAQMVEYGRTLTTDKAITFEGPPMKQAVDYANTRAARMVTEMDIETKDRLARAISNGIKNKRGVDGLASDIRKQFSDMSKNRSKLIARTETNDSLSEGSFQRMKDMGITGKRWLTAGDADVRPAHRANEAAGIIPRDDPFPDGSMRTPGVDPFNCRCVTVPAMLPK